MIYWGYIGVYMGIMENRMETTIVYRVILVLKSLSSAVEGKSSPAKVNTCHV